MWRIFIFILSLNLILLLNCVLSEKARYDNYRVYDIFIGTNDQLDLMREIQKYPDGVSLFFIFKKEIN